MSNGNPILFGKYQLLASIARGGMAEVWKAKAHGVEGFEKILVIKRILPGLSENPRFVEMFINEAKIAVTLSHANVVQVFDLGHAEGSYYIAMEYVAGMDLSSLLKNMQKQTGRLSPGLSAYVISELAKGLDYAHRRRGPEGNLLNIVHRDVSPQNILLSFEGEVKLTDFGIAKARSFAQSVTELGVVKGKYAYMAPEQLMGGAVDARADVFAAGTLLYECLSGENPFQAESTYDTLQRIRGGEIKAIEEAAPGVTSELAEIVRRAMAFRADERYPTAGHFYEDLIQYLYGSGQHVGARELSEQIRRLRVSQEESPNAAKLRRAFEVDHVGGFEDASDLIEDLSSEEDLQGADDLTRVGRRIPRESPSTRPPMLTPHRERIERRDITAMCVRRDADDGLKAKTIRILVERFGGTLFRDEVLEDGVQVTYALFGDRVPDGRDSDNAGRCALRLSRAASASAAEQGLATSVAIGIQAGRVLIDLEGGLLADKHIDSLLAHALSQAGAAAPSQIVVDSETERELRSRFRLVLAGAQHGEGHILANERSMADAYGRFIGRREVLKAIGESLAKANRGTLQVIGLTGEAGSGKSRLLVETMRRLNLAGHSAGLHVAPLTPQMREVPLSAIQEMLRVVLGVDEFDPEAFLRDRTTRLRELGLVSAEQTAVAAALGLPTESKRGGQRPLRAALIRIIRKLAEDRLTIFAWDGAEYMDVESLAVVDDLLRSVSEARVSVLLSYRPGFVSTWADLDNFREIKLSALTDDEVARLTATRLGADEIPFELLREITTKSGGNPLYVEEYIKALQEAGAVVFDEGQVIYRPDVAHVDVPKTLRGIIASRISRLPSATRYLLQVAALAGERFNLDVVAAASEEAVGHVESALTDGALRGIVHGRGADRVFAHGLVRQVMLESITLSARKEIHLALAHAVLSLHPDLEDELAERLARHFEAADQYDKAVEYLRRAAERLEQEGALESAITVLERALEIMASVEVQDREAMFAFYERVADLCYRSRALLRGVEVLGKAIKRAEAAKAPRWVASFCMWRGRLLAAASRIEEGRRWLDQAQQVARGLTDVQLSREVFVATADVDARRGEFERAVGYLREALLLAEHDDDPGVARLRCLLPLSLTYARMGDQKSALETWTEAKALATQLSVPPATLCQVHRLESQIHYHARDQRASAEAAARAVEVAREANLVYEEALNAHNMGESYLRLGDHRRAFAALRNSYELSTERGYGRLQMSNLRALGFIDATRFGSAEGRARVAQTIAYAEKHDYAWDIIQGKYLMAIIEQGRGATEEARQLARDVLELAVQHSHRKYTEDAEDALRCLDEGEPIPLSE